MKTTKYLFFFLVAILAGCGGSAGLPVDASAPQPITITGTVMDGPVSGGRVFLFTVADINSALDSADSADDRLAALQDAGALISRARVEADGETYSVDLPGGFANTPIFIVFDNTDAEDETFGDQPLNMETVVVLGGDGVSVVANITPHTSMITTQVRALVIATSTASDVNNEIGTATANVIAAVGTDEFGNILLEDGIDIIGTTDTESLEEGSTFIGGLVRATAAVSGVSRRGVLLAIGADSADGHLDGVVPAALDVADDVIEIAAEVADSVSAGRLDFEITGGSCSVAANLLAKACEFDVIDDFLEGQAICQNTDDEEEFAECLSEVSEQKSENVEECEAINEARFDLCEDLDDEPHTPEFGEEFADNFVDPRDIGVTVDPNPWLPLIAGNIWVYEGTFLKEAEEDDEEAELVTEVVTVTVTDRIKLIEGIKCLVVNDQVEKNGELIENTDDWYAQDIAGNVWYCGEIAENFEFFEDDDPVEPELVDIEGSWKHGRETAEAGILLPFAPEVGQVIRQEVLYGEAEDAIEILSLEGDESTSVVSCNNSCLVTRDFTPLEPDAEEQKYYVAGIGQILEVDTEEDVRIELISFTQGTP